ncbi:unnamed protein product [Rhizoctonia solani]|uniref:Uncharacterized protein n=1 Tax=Rhizoctonia solani TaxID=456999 RepID=A0A8H3DXN9_9AGAM|nr:unnamed protein product [Rhizoctonia solani]
MAKSAALGGWLQASARRGKSPGTEFGEISPGAITRRVAVWNIRGILWLTTAIWWTLIDIQGGLTYPLPPKILPLPNILICALSITWQFWDPTWKSLQQTRLQGHEARVEGKVSWLRCQGLIWMGRAFLTLALRFQASFISRGTFWFAMFFELLINFFAFRSIHIVRPPRIRLVASSRAPYHVSGQTPGSHTTLDAPSIQPPTDVPTFSGLSLSSTFSPTRPTRTVNPIFGVTSLPQSQLQFQSLPGEHNNVDPSDTMDWTPTAGYTRDEAAELLRPARFAPEKPTGLEGLIEKFGIDGDETGQPTAHQASATDSESSGVERGVAIGVLVGLGLVGIVVFIVTWWPQWLAMQQNGAQVLTPQHLADDF